MASIQYAYGDCRPMQIPIANGKTVAVGDLVGESAGTLVKASDQAWASAVATPSAPTVAASAASRGTALTNALTGVKVSLNFPWGEGALSTAGTATPTAAYGLQVTLAALPAPALSWNVYVETAAGSGVYQLQQVTTVSAGIIFVDSYGTGRVPPSAVLSGALQVTQYNFAQLFQGVSAQAMRATDNLGNTTIQPYGNSLPVCRVDTDGCFTATCTSATFKVGDYVGPDKDTGNLLLNQQVVAVAHSSLAVGQIVLAGTSVTTVKIRIISPVKGS